MRIAHYAIRALAGAILLRGAASEFAVAAYLPEWRYEGANWDAIARRCTHVILFSMEPSRDGALLAHDRLPRAELLAQAKAACAAHGAKLLVCFGGNGRSGGFSAMSRAPRARARFVAAVAALVAEHGLDGVDYNWEYPGYDFRRGYLPEAEVEADYDGLAALCAETRAALAAGAVITMAYYPDGRQERLLAARRVPASVDLMHMMTYDQHGAQHSSREFAARAVRLGADGGLPRRAMTLGVPFYGRHSRTGDWTTYEDLVQRHHPLDRAADAVPAPEREGGATIGFNGVDTIVAKTRLAARERLGGVMIWEVGQDCRLAPVTHGETTHVATCPDGEESSLLVAIQRTIATEAASAGGEL